MRRAIAIAVVATGLGGCNMISTLIDGLKHVQAVENDLQQETGVRPRVSFNWHNGQLEVVTVTFPRLYEKRPIGELAGTVRNVIAREFRQKPENIVLAFSLGESAPPPALPAPPARQSI